MARSSRPDAPRPVKPPVLHVARVHVEGTNAVFVLPAPASIIAIDLVELFHALGPAFVKAGLL